MKNLLIALALLLPIHAEEITATPDAPPAANTEGVLAAGFKRLFDGKTLDGWNHQAAPEWTVANGILKCAAKPPTPANLVSASEYADFTLVFDWRWSGPSPLKTQVPDKSGRIICFPEVALLTSGVLLRGSTTTLVALTNTAAGSGGITTAKLTPKSNADQPFGQWNRTLITLKGGSLTVTLNGRQILDNVTLPTTPPFPAKGPIALQSTGSAIDFANIWIKEL
jgi:Domain of Unknown Function (DUF1080)